MPHRVYQPRNDQVIIREHKRSILDGLAMPDESIEGKVFIVEAIGPKVEGLKVGDKVWMSGLLNATYANLPCESDLLIMEQKYVLTTWEEAE
jgi:hypothetical protein